MSELRYITVRDVFCPRCHAPEVNPDDRGLLFVRGFKVVIEPSDGPWSHCLRCHCWFSADTGKIDRCDTSCDCHETYPVRDPAPFIVVSEEA